MFGDRGLIRTRTQRQPLPPDLAVLASAVLNYTAVAVSIRNNRRSRWGYCASRQDSKFRMRRDSTSPTQLLKILEADWNARTADAWKPHPMFGKMTPAEWGKLLQIHMDCHLRQFAA
jgi:Protein of unknown function (DUF1569)